MTDAIDLFRGAGGWSLAAQRLGVTDHGVENAKWANATAEAAGFTALHEDVWDLALNHSYQGQIASPPCPTFSVAGKGKGRAHLETVIGAIRDRTYFDRDRLRALPTDDERTNLVLVPLWHATHTVPEWIAWEQVPAVLPVWEACATELERYGYRTWTGYLTSEMYGVPQTRKRAILMAHYHRAVQPPEPTHSRYYPRNPTKLDPNVKPWVSMAEALGWDENFHVVSNYGTGGDPKNRGVRLGSQPSATQTEKGGRNKVEWWGPGGLDPRRPATTVAGDPRLTSRTHHDPGTQGRNAVSSEDVRESLENGHPDWVFNRPSTSVVGTFKPEIQAAPAWRTTVSRQDEKSSVRTTVRERGILQSFPADYPWRGPKSAQDLQVGNAIPPLLAEAILRELV